MKDVETDPCPHCGNPTVEKFAPHTHEWSRLVLNTMVCKQCGKVISTDDYMKGNYERATTSETGTQG